jgi:hypothetical protein
MNKLILLGHPSSGIKHVESLLLSSGMQTALPSKRDGLMPADMVQTLCQAHQCADIEEASTEDELATVQAGPIWNGLALDLILDNLSQPIWGWADSRNIYWLDYWASLDPHATFVMVYDHPRSALQAKFTEIKDQQINLESNRLLENWQAYNGAMLRFYSRHSSRCLLINAKCAREQLKIYLTQLGTQLHGKPPKLDSDDFPLIEANDQVNSKLATNLALAISEVPVTSADAITAWFNGYTDLDQHLLDEFLQDFPAALQVFEELEAASTVPRLHKLLVKVQPGEAWLDLIKQRQATADLVINLYGKFQNNLSELQAVHEKIKNLEIELDESKKIITKTQNQSPALAGPKEKELEEENELLLFQLHQVQEELERYYLENQSLKKNPLKPNVKIYGAAERIQQQLSYRLGSTMIANSRSISGWFKMPFSLLEQVHAYRSGVRGKHDKKLPPIHAYADAYEAERYKQHLSYQLGQKLVRHGTTPWGWVILPFALLGTVKSFRKVRR